MALKHFKLVRGQHTQVEKEPGKRGKRISPITDGINEGKLLGYQHTYSALIPRRVRRHNQEVIELSPREGFTVADQYVASETDLVQRCGVDKFEYCSQEEATQYDGISAEELVAAEKGSVENLDDGLTNMTLQELRAMAKANNIDLRGATDKQSVIDIIRQASVPA